MVTIVGGTIGAGTARVKGGLEATIFFREKKCKMG
jgi:hypothetical protein